MALQHWDEPDKLVDLGNVVAVNHFFIGLHSPLFGLICQSFLEVGDEVVESNYGRWAFHKDSLEDDLDIFRLFNDFNEGI